jgi:hypothetical protein
MGVLPTVHGYHIPLLYRIFFGLFEPLSAINGTYLIIFYPEHFYILNGLLPSSTDSVLPTATIVILYQLAIMFGSFGVSEAVILHMSDSLKTWKIYIASLLLSDFGVLWSMHPLGIEYYWSPGEWNYIAGGSYALCYICIIIRISFVLGIGIKQTGTVRT